MKIGKALILFLLSYILLLIEETHLFSRLVLVDDHSMFFAFIILIPSLFYLTTCYSGNLSQNSAYLIRKLSTGIFFLHANIRTICEIVLMQILHAPEAKKFEYCIVLLLSAAITVLLYKIDNPFTRKCRIFIGG